MASFQESQKFRKVLQLKLKASRNSVSYIITKNPNYFIHLTMKKIISSRQHGVEMRL